MLYFRSNYQSNFHHWSLHVDAIFQQNLKSVETASERNIPTRSMNHEMHNFFGFPLNLGLLFLFFSFFLGGEVSFVIHGSFVRLLIHDFVRISLLSILHPSTRRIWGNIKAPTTGGNEMGCLLLWDGVRIEN